MLFAGILRRSKTILNETLGEMDRCRPNKSYREEMVTVIDQGFDQRKEIVAETNEVLDVVELDEFT